MKFNVEKVSGLERRLHVEVPLDKVSQAFNRIYKRIQNQVTIQGFRKGKAPITTVKSMYGDHARKDVLDLLIQEAYVRALEDNSLDPVNMPKFNIEALSEASPFKFTAEFEVRPDVNLQQYTNLPVDREKMVYDDAQIDKAIVALQENRAAFVQMTDDRPAKMDDFAVIDFTGEIDGQPLENAAGKEYQVKLGSGDLIPGFEEGVVGMKIGDSKTLNLAFPAEYHADHLAGKSVVFQVTLKELKKKDLPPVDDEFAKSVGFENIEKLRDIIKIDQMKTETKRIQEDFKNRLLKTLVERNPVDVPKSMMDEQKKLLHEDMKERFTRQGGASGDFEDYKSKWDDDFTKTASFMIQSSFLISAIGTKENLRASDSDIDAKIQEYASEVGIEESKLKSFYEKDENRGRLLFKITEDKVIEFLTSKAAVREVEKAQLKG